MTGSQRDRGAKAVRCIICAEELAPGTRVCAICGSTQPDAAVPVAAPVPSPIPAIVAPALPTNVPPGSRVCPACAAVYGADYFDTFCTCGVELIVPPAPASPAASEPVRPPAGTPCLVLYGPDKQPLRYFPLTQDATLIGRLDPVAGVFPEIDVTQWLDSAVARKVSRQHALVLRTRSGGGFALRPLAGNTGTQIEADMVPPLADYPLKPGTRIILGGAVRIKFETA
ncbi:MAG: FHA domain-containing protein [Gemmataceae bacterium]|nr:FHA domain-containing protein [Gemmataceae bacterium]